MDGWMDGQPSEAILTFGVLNSLGPQQIAAIKETPKIILFVKNWSKKHPDRILIT
jgi:hypothetical protein